MSTIKTIGELIAELQKFDPNSHVEVVYETEASNVLIYNNDRIEKVISTEKLVQIVLENN